MMQIYYAHRGLHDLAQGVPENSITAFRRAAGRGYGAELDVHLLADGALAVFHDSDLRRMTGRDGVIEDLTAAQLGEYRLGGTEETIPQLCDVLKIFERAKLPLVVELKSWHDNYDALTERTVAEMDKYGVPYVMESFDPRCLLWLRRNRPEIIRGQLSQDFTRAPERASGLGERADRLLARMAFNRFTKPHFVAYRFEDRDAPALRRIVQKGRPVVFYWTVRSAEELEIAEAEDAQVIFEGFLP